MARPHVTNRPPGKRGAGKQRWAVLGRPAFARWRDVRGCLRRPPQAPENPEALADGSSQGQEWGGPKLCLGDRDRQPAAQKTPRGRAGDKETARAAGDHDMGKWADAMIREGKCGKVYSSESRAFSHEEATDWWPVLLGKGPRSAGDVRSGTRGRAEGRH